MNEGVCVTQLALLLNMPSIWNLWRREEGTPCVFHLRVVMYCLWGGRLGNATRFQVEGVEGRGSGKRAQEMQCLCWKERERERGRGNVWVEE